MCACREADLITVDHNVVCGDEGFEQDHPAGVGGALEQRVGQLRDVHIHLIGAMDQTCKTKMKEVSVFIIQTVSTSQPLYLDPK